MFPGAANGKTFASATMFLQHCFLVFGRLKRCTAPVGSTGKYLHRGQAKGQALCRIRAQDLRNTSRMLYLFNYKNSWRARSFILVLYTLNIYSCI